MTWNVIWDLGNVLIRWDPRNLYKQYFQDVTAMEHFLTHVCSPAWNERQDAGRPIAEAEAELIALHPSHSQLIRAFYSEWEVMLGGVIETNVALVKKLHARRTPIYALSNWSAETFPRAQPLFPFLGLFNGVVLSGKEGLIKPDLKFYQVLFDRYGLEPEECVFIDDAPKNIAAARQLGMQGIIYDPSVDVETELRLLGVL